MTAKISTLHLAVLLLGLSACVVEPAGYYDAGPAYPGAGYYGYGPAYPWNSGVDIDIVGGYGHGSWGRGGYHRGGWGRGGYGHGGSHGGWHH